MKKTIILLALVLLVVPLFLYATGGTETQKAPVKLKVLVLYWDENRHIMHKDYYLPNIKKDLPDLDVEFELGASDSGTYLAKLRTYLAAGDLPDIWFSIGKASSTPLLT